MCVCNLSVRAAHCLERKMGVVPLDNASRSGIVSEDLTKGENSG